MLSLHERPTKTVKLGRNIQDKQSVQLFQNVHYAIDETLPRSQQKTLNNILINNGGIPAQTGHSPNVYVSQTKRYQPMNKSEVVETVTPLWVEKAINNGFVHDTKYYAPGENQFLSGEVLLLLDLPSESEAIYNQINKYGGQYREDIVDDVTCLICIDPRGAHYNECMDRNVPVVLPQWLDDCFRYRQRLDYEPYRFPTPTNYHPLSPHPATLYPYPTDTKTLATFLPNHYDEAHQSLQNQVVYFGTDVMTDQRKIPIIPTIKDHIEKAGGQLVTEYNHHLVTIVILKHRSSIEYKRATQDQKCIASFWWLTNTLARGYMCSPLDGLLDFPVPKIGIAGMRDCVIAVTGFKGASRAFINTLIVAVGARYSPELEKDTTHLICGGGYGNKYLHITKYPNVIRANHIWLEECYAKWKKLDHTKHRRYTYIPRDNALLANTVAKTTLNRHVLKRWDSFTCDAEPEVVYEEYQHDDVGFISERKPRQAALRALCVLNDIVIPDINAYEKEVRLHASSNSHNAHSHKRGVS